jgi:uncharacterized membrane protein YcjF (UPF0283 family)
MVLAVTTYPLLEVFWTILIVFAFIVWLWILFSVLSDLFRRHDASGWAKVAWVLFIVILPYLGTLVYLLVNHRGMAERSEKQAKAVQGEVEQYVRSVAGRTDPAQQIATAKELLDKGTINQEEFDQIKRHALAGS